jgi:replicative DNA helicase
MWGASEFGPDFQRVLVRACIDDPHTGQLVRRFTADQQLAFTDPAAAWAWQVISGMDRPSLLALETESRRLAADEPARLGIETILSIKDVRQLDYVRDKIVEWCRRQVFRLGFEEAREAWNQQDFEKSMSAMMRRIEEVNRIQVLDADRGWFFEEYDLRQQRRDYVDAGLDVFPTGVDLIDKGMYGGLSYGELGVPMAYSKIGKSFWCVTQGVMCVRSRRRALHCVLEGGRKKTEDRYEAAFTNTIYSEVRRGAIADHIAAMARREYAILQQGLVIRAWAEKGTQWAVGMEEINAELQMLRRTTGWVPDMVIVDYGDLMNAPGDTEQQRQKNAFRQLKSLAERQEYPGHQGYAVWSPTQAQRPAKGADEHAHVLKGRDIADCYEKVRVCDAIITLNRTLLEKEHNQMRVCLSDYRDAEDGRIVRVTTDYDHGMVCVPGEATEPPEPKAGEAASAT